MRATISILFFLIAFSSEAQTIPQLPTFAGVNRAELPLDSLIGFNTLLIDSNLTLVSYNMVRCRGPRCKTLPGYSPVLSPVMINLISSSQSGDRIFFEAIKVRDMGRRYYELPPVSIKIRP